MTTENWHSLEPQWQIAFNIVLGNTANNELPDEEQLAALAASKVIRLVGPSAPYPNMDFELTNASGLTLLPLLEIVVLSHHKIDSLQELAHLKQVKSLFVLNNRLTSLSGIEGYTDLEILYCQNNLITDLLPLQQLTNLQELYVSRNKLKNIDGITAHHEPKLNKFYVLPNEGLRDKDVMRFEQALGIRCKVG